MSVGSFWITQNICSISLLDVCVSLSLYFLHSPRFFPFGFCKGNRFYVTRIYIFVCLNLATFFSLPLFRSSSAFQLDKLKLSTHTFDIAYQCGCRCVWNIVVERANREKNQISVCSSGVNFVDFIPCFFFIHFKTRVENMKIIQSRSDSCLKHCRILFSSDFFLWRWLDSSDLIVHLKFLYFICPSHVLLVGVWNMDLEYFPKFYRILCVNRKIGFIRTQNGEKSSNNSFRLCMFSLFRTGQLEFAINFIVNTILLSNEMGKKGSQLFITKPWLVNARHPCMEGVTNWNEFSLREPLATFPH